MKKERNEALNSINTHWDIGISGGGAIRRCIAAESASRCYKTILVEQYASATGTRSKRTKLVNGGVRYLANGDIEAVYCALRECLLISKNAPHVSFVQSLVT